MDDGTCGLDIDVRRDILIPHAFPYNYPVTRRIATQERSLDIKLRVRREGHHRSPSPATVSRRSVCGYCSSHHEWHLPESRLSQGIMDN